MRNRRLLINQSINTSSILTIQTAVNLYYNLLLYNVIPWDFIGRKGFEWSVDTKGEVMRIIFSLHKSITNRNN